MPSNTGRTEDTDISRVCATDSTACRNPTASTREKSPVTGFSGRYDMTVKIIAVVITMGAVIAMLCFALAKTLSRIAAMHGELKGIRDRMNVMKEEYNENRKRKEKLETGDSESDFNNSVDILSDLAERRTEP